MDTHSSDQNRKNVPSLCGVIGVLAVLGFVAAVVFFPVFAHHQPTRKTICICNLKQIGVALSSYMYDNNGMLPSSKLVNGSKSWNQADFLKFGTQMGHYGPWDGKKQTWHDALYDYVKSKDALWCPSDPARDEQPTDLQTANPTANCSYWWKLAIDKAWYGVGCKKPRQKEEDFAFPSEQIILYEREPFHAGVKGLKNEAMINAVYLDSHVKSIYLKNATSGDPITCAANTDGEPMYFNCNGDTGGGAENPETPAKFVDPGIYCDRL